MNIADFFLRNEVAGVADVAEMLGVSQDETRDWARENGVPRLGYAFAFTKAKALELQDELDEPDDELDEADDELDDELDEADDQRVSYG